MWAICQEEQYVPFCDLREFRAAYDLASSVPPPLVPAFLANRKQTLVKSATPAKETPGSSKSAPLDVDGDASVHADIESIQRMLDALASLKTKLEACATFCRPICVGTLLVIQWAILVATGRCFSIELPISPFTHPGPHHSRCVPFPVCCPTRRDILSGIRPHLLLLFFFSSRLVPLQGIRGRPMDFQRAKNNADPFEKEQFWTKEKLKIKPVFDAKKERI